MCFAYLLHKNGRALQSSLNLHIEYTHDKGRGDYQITMAGLDLQAIAQVIGISEVQATSQYSTRVRWMAAICSCKLFGFDLGLAESVQVGELIFVQLGIGLRHPDVIVVCKLMFHNVCKKYP